jgi:hypothetical protein
MAKYRKHPWQEYFKAFEQANLTQTEFCKQHDLNPKYFSQKLAQHKMRNSAFTKVSVEPTPSVLTGLMLDSRGPIQGVRVVDFMHFLSNPELHGRSY